MYPSPENPLKRKHDTVDSTTSLSSAPASSKEEKQHQFRWDLKNVTHKALESGLEADKWLQFARRCISNSNDGSTTTTSAADAKAKVLTYLLSSILYPEATPTSTFVPTSTSINATPSDSMADVSSSNQTATTTVSSVLASDYLSVAMDSSYPDLSITTPFEVACSFLQLLMKGTKTETVSAKPDLVESVAGLLLDVIDDERSREANVISQDGVTLNSLLAFLASDREIETESNIERLLIMLLRDFTGFTSDFENQKLSPDSSDMIRNLRIIRQRLISQPSPSSKIETSSEGDINMDPLTTIPSSDPSSSVSSKSLGPLKSPSLASAALTFLSQTLEGSGTWLASKIEEADASSFPSQSKSNLKDEDDGVKANAHAHASDQLLDQAVDLVEEFWRMNESQSSVLPEDTARMNENTNSDALSQIIPSQAHILVSQAIIDLGLASSSTPSPTSASEFEGNSSPEPTPEAAKRLIHLSAIISSDPTEALYLIIRASFEQLFTSFDRMAQAAFLRRLASTRTTDSGGAGVSLSAGAESTPDSKSEVGVGEMDDLLGTLMEIQNQRWLEWNWVMHGLARCLAYWKTISIGERRTEEGEKRQAWWKATADRWTFPTNIGHILQRVRTSIASELSTFDSQMKNLHQRHFDYINKLARDDRTSGLLPLTPSGQLTIDQVPFPDPAFLTFVHTLSDRAIVSDSELGAMTIPLPLRVEMSSREYLSWQNQLGAPAARCRLYTSPRLWSSFATSISTLLRTDDISLEDLSALAAPTAYPMLDLLCVVLSPSILQQQFQMLLNKLANPEDLVVSVLDDPQGPLTKFGQVVLICQTLHDRFGAPLPQEIAPHEVFALSDLSEDERACMSSWVQALFGTSGIGDDLLQSTPPASFFRLAPTLVSQAIIAHADGVINETDLMNGLSYFSQNLLSWSQISILKSLGDEVERKRDPIIISAIKALVSASDFLPVILQAVGWQLLRQLHQWPNRQLLSSDVEASLSEVLHLLRKGVANSPSQLVSMTDHLEVQLGAQSSTAFLTAVSQQLRSIGQESVITRLFFAMASETSRAVFAPLVATLCLPFYSQSGLVTEISESCFKQLQDLNIPVHGERVLQVVQACLLALQIESALTAAAGSEKDVATTNNQMRAFVHHLAVLSSRHPKDTLQHRLLLWLGQNMCMRTIAPNMLVPIPT